jgi:hypothetical protein
MAGYGTCSACHFNPTGTYVPEMTPIDLTGFQNVDMGDNKPCAECHGNNVFTSQLPQGRCGDCHAIKGGGYDY